MGRLHGEGWGFEDDNGVFGFALADCDPCPLRPQCTKAAHGRWGRSLTLLSREQHELLARQRAEQQTPE